MRPEHSSPEQLDEQLGRLTTILGLPLDSGEQKRLLSYLAMIQRWTQVYNLTAVRDAGEMLTHHLLDCLAVVEPMRMTLQLANATVLDVGSGAGLPGVVLALLNPGWEVFCVDAVGKKASFIRQVATELNISNLHGVHGRVEAPATFGERRFDLVTSRAFASLRDFTALTRPLLKPRACWAAMKARLSAEELDELPPDIETFHVEQLSVPELDAERCLVWMKLTASEQQPRQ